MKFPYLIELGKQQGWYRVGPLARVNNCDLISTPLAEAARKRFREFGNGGFVQDTLAYHWARMIEALHCAESINELLHDPEIIGSDLVADLGEKRREGIGVIEAPRGTLFHHYRIDDDGSDRKSQPDRLDHQQQPGDERIGALGRQRISGRP